MEAVGGRTARLPFRNREHAALALAEALAAFRGRHPLILAIPRGAVAMGRVLAECLDGDLDVVLARKIGAPWNPELAVGAIDETGWRYVAPHAWATGIDEAYLQREGDRQLDLIRRRRRRYTPGRAPLDPAGRTVIVVDDGLATGATMIAALHAVRRGHPATLVCAVPVAAEDALAAVRPWADTVVCLSTPAWFAGVGAHYIDFAQVDDEDVVSALAFDHRRGPAGGADLAGGE